MKLFWIITTIAYALKIVGLAPFSQQTKKLLLVNSRKTCLIRIFEVSKIGIAYNFLLLIAYQVLAVIVYPILSSWDYSNKSPITFAIDQTLTLGGCLSIDYLFVYWSFQQKNAASIMNKLIEIHHLLSCRDKQPVPDKKILIFLAAHVISSSFIFIGHCILSAWMFSGINIIGSFFIITVFVIYCFIFEYFMVVSFLAKKFEQVNKNLSNLNVLSNYLFSRETIVYTYIPVLNSSTHSQLATLQLLCSIRTILFELSREIADLFSSPILLTVGFSVCDLVYNVYYLISLLLASTSDLVVIFDTIFEILINVYPISMLSFIMTKAANEARLTGRIVHTLLATTPAMKQDVKATLKQFSIQLLHERVKFTACGLFQLDCTMLHSILGATATYLVILIQFQQTEDNISTNTTTVEN